MIALILASFTALAQDAAPPVPETASYTLNAAKSRLYVLVKYSRSALIAGHDHVIAASTFDGSVTWNPADPSVCKVDIRFPVSALQVDPGAARDWEKLEGETSEGDKKSITSNMLGKHQLQGDRFPMVTFESEQCIAAGERTEVMGTLSLHGVPAKVRAKMDVQADGSTFSARGTFTASHGDWGMSPFTALLGSLKNDDALKFVVNVKGTAK